MAYPVQGSASNTPREPAKVARKPLPPHDAVRRLQIGIAGVIAVLLLVGLAGLASDRARESAGASGLAAQDNGSAPSGNYSPLEELGVQPVAKDNGGAAGMAEGASLRSDPMVPAPRQSVPDLEPDPALERARQQKN